MKHTQKGLLLSLIIFLTFVAISLYGAYHGALQAHTFMREKELPAVGLAVSAKLDKAAYRYKKIGEELLQDDVLRDWILSGEQDLDKVVTFMRKIRDRYDLIDASLVSDKTEKYYNTDYTVLQLSPENEKRDGWYYLYRDSVEGANIDSWTFEESGLTQIFINVPILDYNGDYIGVTGAGIHSDEIRKTIVSFEQEYGVDIQIARKDGKVIFANDKQIGHSLSESTLDTLIRNQTRQMGVVFEDSKDNSSLFWGSYLGDWNSFLLVEKKSSEIKTAMRESMLRRFLPLGGLALILFLIGVFTIRFTFKGVSSLLARKEKKLSMQEISLRITGRYVHTLDTKGEYHEAVRQITHWAKSSFGIRNGKLSPEEVLEPVLLSISYQAEKYSVSLHWKLEKTSLVLDRDQAFALVLAFREICRHIFEIAVPGIIIPISGSTSEGGYTLELPPTIRGNYFSSKIIGEVHSLLSITGISLSIENSNQGKMSIRIFVPN